MKKVIMALCTMVLATSCVYSLNLNMNNRVVCKGEVKTEQMDLGDFNQIVLNGAADLEIFQAETCQVKVEANEEVFQYLDFRVEDGTLVLETKKDGKSIQISAKTFKVYVNAPLLESVMVNGAADANLHAYTSDKDLVMMVNGAGDVEMDSIKVPSLSFTINGAGDLEATSIDVEKLYVSVNGAGDVDVSGKAGYAKLSVTGAGDIDAYNLDCPQVDKSKAGVASIRLKKD